MDRYNARIAGLESRVPGRRPVRRQTIVENPFVFDPKGWEVTERTGGTYTAGTDWETQFDDPSVSYTLYDIPTLTGWFVMHPSSSRPARARLVFRSEAPGDRDCYVGADAWGRVQIRANGALVSEITSDSTVTVPICAGYNVIDVLTDGTADRIELRGRVCTPASIEAQ